MQLSKFSDYSLRVLIFAAARDPEPVGLDGIAESYGISRNHVVKVVQKLAHLGWVTTRRGKGGGIRLGHPADQIRLGEVVRQTESTLALVECFDAARNRCRLTPACRLKGVLHEAQDAFFQALDRYTIDDLAVSPERVHQLLHAS